MHGTKRKVADGIYCATGKQVYTSFAHNCSKHRIVLFILLFFQFTYPLFCVCVLSMQRTNETLRIYMKDVKLLLRSYNEFSLLDSTRWGPTAQRWRRNRGRATQWDLS